MPPHVIMGYSLAEWVALCTLVSVFIAIVTWFVNVSIIKPLRQDIKNLAKQFKSFQDETKTDNHELNKMVRDHENRLIRLEDKTEMGENNR